MAGFLLSWHLLRAVAGASTSNRLSDGFIHCDQYCDYHCDNKQNWHNGANTKSLEKRSRKWHRIQSAMPVVHSSCQVLNSTDGFIAVLDELFLQDRAIHNEWRRVSCTCSPKCLTTPIYSARTMHLE